MIKKKVVQIGTPSIRKKSKDVKDIKTKETKRVIRDLIDSMRHHDLVGMAGPQIGNNVRIFVTEVRATKFRKKKRKTDPLRVYVNPKVVETSKDLVSGYEACGSVADAHIFGPVKRPKWVVIKDKDDRGEMFELKAA